jgi:hypothetical protein
MNLHGAKLSEIVGLMNRIAQNDWTRLSPPKAAKAIWQASENVAGMNLRVVHTYHAKGLENMTLRGNGWIVSLMVTKQRPRSFEDDVPSESVNLWLARNATVPNMITARLCVHTPFIISPDQFQKEMTILRMFSSEWEL